MKPAVSAILVAIANLGCSGTEEGNASVPGKTPAQVADIRRAALDTSARTLVLRARAYDRADNLDSARVLYEEAASLAPQIKDWLYLRAAGVARDKSQRDRLLDRVELPAAAA